jgi:hypothetical protein
MEETTFKTVTFRNPFLLGGLDGLQEAGSYLVETVVEPLDTVVTPGSRIVSMCMHVTSPSAPGVTRLIPLNPAELEGALILDRAAPPERLV